MFNPKNYPRERCHNNKCFVLLWTFVGSSSLDNLYTKPYRKWPTAVKAFKKHQNAPTGTHKKSQILLIRFLDE